MLISVSKRKKEVDGQQSPGEHREKLVYMEEEDSDVKHLDLRQARRVYSEKSTMTFQLERTKKRQKKTKREGMSAVLVRQ